MEILPRNIPVEQYVLLISALISIVLIIIVKIYFKRPISSIFFEAFKFNKKRTYYKTELQEGSSKTNVISGLLIFIFFINVLAVFFAFFAYVYSGNNVLGKNFYSLYSLISMFLFAYLTVKLLIIIGMGIIFNIYKIIFEYLGSIFYYFKITGIILIPIYLVIPFVDNSAQQILIYICFGIIAISFLLRIIKGFLLSFQEKFLIHYLILYFCIFEIFPILIIAKYFKEIL